MADPDEIARLAAAINALRPEWPVKALVTHLTTHHAARPYRDLGLALTWIALDPATRTPARLREHGPWWEACAANREAATRLPPRHTPCDEPGHTGTDLRCPECIAARPTPDEIARIRAEMRTT